MYFRPVGDISSYGKNEVTFLRLIRFWDEGGCSIDPVNQVTFVTFARSYLAFSRKHCSAFRIGTCTSLLLDQALAVRLPPIPQQRRDRHPWRSGSRCQTGSIHKHGWYIDSSWAVFSHFPIHEAVWIPPEISSESWSNVMTGLISSRGHHIHIPPPLPPPHTHA